MKQFCNLSSRKRGMVAIDEQIIEFHAPWEQQMKCRVRPGLFSRLTKIPSPFVKYVNSYTLLRDPD
jgi:hypothetical protein